jgi:hypothetical protein
MKAMAIAWRMIGHITRGMSGDDWIKAPTRAPDDVPGVRTPGRGLRYPSIGQRQIGRQDRQCRRAAQLAKVSIVVGAQVVPYARLSKGDKRRVRRLVAPQAAII